MKKQTLLVAALLGFLALAAGMALWIDSLREGQTVRDRQSAREEEEEELDERSPAQLVGSPAEEVGRRTEVPGEGKGSAEVQEAPAQLPVGAEDPEPALAHHILVIDGPTGAPIAEATVERHRVGLDGAWDVRFTGGDGRAELALTRPDFLRVTAEGYGAVLLKADYGDAQTAANAEVVSMRIPGALFGVVSDVHGAPRAGVRVLGTKRRLERLGPAVETETDGEGRYRLELEARVSFRLRLVGPNGETLREEPNSWMLEPGEQRECNWRVGDAARVTGVAVDQDGKPVAALPVMLYEGWSPQRQYVTSIPSARIRAWTSTGPDGSFDLGQVPVGRYVLAPGGERGEAVVPPDVAPFGEELRVDGATPAIFRELVIWRGLTVTGRVVYPDGAPVTGCEVGGWPDGAEGILGADVDAEGNFELGPLAAGVIGLEVEHRGFGLWKPLKVEAGARDVLLVLTEGGSFSGRVEPRTADEEDGGSRPIEGYVNILPSKGSPTNGFIVGTSLDTGGTFSMNQLAPGYYDVVVWTDDGRTGFTPGVEVRSGAETSGVIVELVPAATVRVRYDGDLTGVRMRCFVGDVELDVDDLVPGRPNVESVPAGTPVRVLVRDKRAGWEDEVTLTLEAGELRELVFPR